jgi:hypothetical protein
MTTANFGAAVSSDDAAMQLPRRANRENRSVVRGGFERFIAFLNGVLPAAAD